MVLKKTEEYNERLIWVAFKIKVLMKSHSIGRLFLWVMFSMAFSLPPRAWAVSKSPAGLAEPYPQHPVRLVCPFPAGGGSDVVARTIAEKLSSRWGQSVITDNRSGASGTIGTDIVAKAAPDGYTLLLSSSSAIAVYPALQGVAFKQLAQQLTPVALINQVPFLLVVHPGFTAKNITELILAAKAKPGLINYASSGNGSASHLSMVLFESLAGIQLNHIPYKGSNPAVIDLVGGQVAVGFNNIVPALPHVRSGRLRALAVSGPQRSHLIPDIPTVAESGLSRFEALQWYGVLVPAKTPSPLVTQLNQALNAVIDIASVSKQLAEEGGNTVHSTATEFSVHIQKEISKWTTIIKSSKIRAE